ncbi:MAG: hypothetical protein RLZZ337_909 [Bacteroidota bacterium]
MHKIILWFVLLVGISGCSESPIIEVQENDAPAQASLEVVAELFSTFDIVDDLATTNEFLLKKGNELLPHDVSITFSDNSFTDGDGVELELDFGQPGNKPYGILCRDGKYRAGTIQLSFSKKYSEIGTDIAIHFSEEKPYYSGDGEVLNQFVGTIHVIRQSEKVLELRTEKLKIEADGIASELTASITAEKELDWAIGIVNDIVNYSGNFALKTGDNILMLNSIEPLQKRYTLECAKYIVKGKLSAEQTKSATSMEIDFDPYNDMACDNVVSMTVNGKTIIYKY